MASLCGTCAKCAPTRPERAKEVGGPGGSFVASADVDGDGLEDVIGLYPVNYMAARGTTGALVHSISAASGLFAGVWAAYCQPMVADFDGDGREELLWCGPYHHGLTTLDASVLWYHAGGAGMAGVGDVDGDGRLELGITGWEKGEGLRCLDAATWSGEEMAMAAAGQCAHCGLFRRLRRQWPG